jgi:Xaa-Pro aminopeptidase
VSARLAPLRATFEAAQIDGILITNVQNRRYLSGFTGSAGALIIDGARALLVTDGRYTEQAGREAAGFEVVIRSLDETLEQCAARQVAPIRRLGFEAGALTVADHATYAELLGDAVTLVPITDLLEPIRAVKDAGELDSLRRAIAITDGALARVTPLLQPAMTEREAAWELHKAMVELGADGLAFEIIAAAGPNSALPHYHGGAAQLGVGRPIVFDFGALLDGYHADMTRTLILGEADEQFTTIYRIVREALRAATDGIRPGTTGQQADALARDVIAAAGYGEYFSHGTGHGVGLQIHEEPGLRKTNLAPLPLRSVFSIEPGIYLPGWGGVRLENLVYLTEQGVETLTQSPFLVASS